MPDKTDRPPFLALDFASVLMHSISIAIREAEKAGHLTAAGTIFISDRADELQKALVAGKVVELQHDGPAIIRDAEPEEEAELGAEQFPLHARSKKVLDL